MTRSLRGVAGGRAANPTPSNDEQSLESLLSQLAANGRAGVNSLLASPRLDVKRKVLYGLVASHMDCLRLDPASQRRQAEAIAAGSKASLVRVSAQRALEYQTMLDDVENWRALWMPAMPPIQVDWHLHHALLWHTIWHLLAAGVGADRVTMMLTMALPRMSRHAMPDRPMIPKLDDDEAPKRSVLWSWISRLLQPVVRAPHWQLIAELVTGGESKR
jgi:hypothetical protein